MCFFYISYKSYETVQAFTLCPWRVDLLWQGPIALTQKVIDMPLGENTQAIQDRSLWVLESEALGPLEQMHIGNTMYKRYDGGICLSPYKTVLASIQESLRDTLYGHILSVYLGLGIHMCSLVDEDFGHIHSVFLSSQMEWGQATLQKRPRTQACLRSTS